MIQIDPAHWFVRKLGTPIEISDAEVLMGVQNETLSSDLSNIMFLFADLNK